MKPSSGWIWAAKTETFAFPFVEIHEIPIDPFLQAVKVPLNSGTTIWCISHSSQFCLICDLAAGELLSHHPGLMKRINSIGPSADPWDTALLNPASCISMQACTRGSMCCVVSNSSFYWHLLGGARLQNWVIGQKRQGGHSGVCPQRQSVP